MPWLSVADAARHFDMARSTLRDRMDRDPDRYRRDAAGRVWVDAAPSPAQGTFPAADTPRAVPAPIDTLPPATPRRPVSSVIEAQRIPSAPHVDRLEKWILIPDCHVPFHDKHAFGLMCRAAKAIGATRCVQMGDLADCYAVSKYPKDVHRRQSAEWELAEVNRALDILDRVFPDERWITLGNHDVRLEKYMAACAPAVAGMLSLNGMLRFTERGWRVTPYLDSATLGDLEVTHEQGWSGKTAASNAIASSFESQANAHTHFLTFHAVGGGDVRTRIGAQFGWLGSYDFIDYAHRKKIMRSHAHGFGIAYVAPGGRTHVVPVAIMDGAVVVEGRLVR